MKDKIELVSSTKKIVTTSLFLVTYIIGIIFFGFILLLTLAYSTMPALVLTIGTLLCLGILTIMIPIVILSSIKGSFIELDENGINYSSLMRNQFISWNDIENISVQNKKSIVSYSSLFFLSTFLLTINLKNRSSKVLFSSKDEQAVQNVNDKIILFKNKLK